MTHKNQESAEWLLRLGELTERSPLLSDAERRELADLQATATLKGPVASFEDAFTDIFETILGTFSKSPGDAGATDTSDVVVSAAATPQDTEIIGSSQSETTFMAPELRRSLVLQLRDERTRTVAASAIRSIYGPVIERLVSQMEIASQAHRTFVEDVFGRFVRLLNDNAKCGATPLRNLLFKVVESAARERFPLGPTSSVWSEDCERLELQWAARQVSRNCGTLAWRAYWMHMIEERPLADVAAELRKPEAWVEAVAAITQLQIAAVARQFSRVSEETVNL